MDLREGVTTWQKKEVKFHYSKNAPGVRLKNGGRRNSQCLENLDLWVERGYSGHLYVKGVVIQNSTIRKSQECYGNKLCLAYK